MALPNVFRPRFWRDASSHPKVSTCQRVAMGVKRSPDVAATTATEPQEKVSKTAAQQDASIAKALATAQGYGSLLPRLATDENVQEMEAYFNKLAVWVQRMVEEAVKTKAPGLRATDFEKKPPYQFGALPIRAVADAEGSSYKAPWRLETARMSLDSTGRYEAGGNVMWLNVVPQSDEARVLAGNPASFQELDELVSQFFDPAFTSGEATSTQPQRGEVRPLKRLIFPVSLPVGVRKKARPSAAKGQIAEEECMVDDQNLRMIHPSTGLIIKAVFITWTIPTHAVATVARHFIPNDSLWHVVEVRPRTVSSLTAPAIELLQLIEFSRFMK